MTNESPDLSVVSISETHGHSYTSTISQNNSG